MLREGGILSPGGFFRGGIFRREEFFVQFGGKFSGGNLFLVKFSGYRCAMPAVKISLVLLTKRF